jgi:hypothetical protein
MARVKLTQIRREIMTVLFLTTQGLYDYVEDNPDALQEEDALFFLDCDRDRLEVRVQQPAAVRAFARAQGFEPERVAWRGLTTTESHRALSELLSSNGFSPLNPNLSPVDNVDFLKTAVERVNNKDGVHRITVIA